MARVVARVPPFQAFEANVKFLILTIDAPQIDISVTSQFSSVPSQFSQLPPAHGQPPMVVSSMTCSKNVPGIKYNFGKNILWKNVPKYGIFLNNSMTVQELYDSARIV